MSRKSLAFSLGIVLFVGGCGGLVALLLRHEPAFYARALPPPGKERKQRSGQFIQDFFQFCQDIRHYSPWNATFDQECINSYFAEQFTQSGLAERVLPPGITDPRVAIEPDRLRFACRYRVGPLSTVISINARLWLVPNEPCVVALQLEQLHAGALPFSAQSLLEQVSEAASQNNIDVIWYRYQGNPVALLRFQKDQDRPAYRLEHLVLRDGAIELRGRSPDAAGLGDARPVGASTATP
jgi:hypothetical protein